MPPKSLARLNPYLLKLEWSDGFSAVISLEKLRDECPCAMCKGESIMGQTVFAGMKMLKPGMNELSALTPVGNYGVQATWNDGHSTGIYTWDTLREIAVRHTLGEAELLHYGFETGVNQ